MKQRLLAQSQKLLRRILRVFSLGAVMFIMEACYGVPYNELISQRLKIMVVDTEGNPIPNISIHLNDYYTGEHFTAISDSKGFAELLILENMGTDIEITLSDIDNEANGLFQSKTFKVNTSNYTEEITVALQPVE